jgi:hypothetical protein
MTKIIPIPSLVDQIFTPKIRQTAQKSSKTNGKRKNSWSSFLNTESLTPTFFRTTHSIPIITQTWLISQAHPM